MISLYCIEREADLNIGMHAVSQFLLISGVFRRAKRQWEQPPLDPVRQSISVALP